MAEHTVNTLARALYEGLPTLANLAESMARQHGNASVLSFYELMGEEVQFFWRDIAGQIIEHSREWQENQGSSCILSNRETLRLNGLRKGHKQSSALIELIRQEAGFKKMKCYLCDKELKDGANEGFVCICNKCLSVMKKSEAKTNKKMRALAEENAALTKQLWLNEVNYDFNIKNQEGFKKF